MIKYNFQINKNLNFVYWVQSIIKWNWYFNKKECDYFNGIAGNFNSAEEKILSSLKLILQKPENAYKWIWDRYSEKPISDKKEFDIWEKSKNILNDKFELIWQKELPKILEWKEKLEGYQFNDLEKFLKSIQNFFGVDFKKEIAVQLCLSYRNDLPGAHVKKGFKNLIVLNISNLDKKIIKEVIDTLIHETSHLIEYESNKNQLLRDSYERIIKPKNLLQDNPSWYHLITESVITSIAGADFSYVASKIFPNQAITNEENLKEFDYQNNKTNYSYQIKSVAYRFRELIKEYLNNNKEMDRFFTDAVVKTWLDFRI